MRTNSPVERIALDPKRETKPIRYWQALLGTAVIDENNSVRLLRHKWKANKSVLFRAIR